MRTRRGIAGRGLARLVSVGPIAIAWLVLGGCSRDHAATTVAGTSPAPMTSPTSPPNTSIDLDPRLAPIAYFVGDWTATAENPSTKQSFTLRYTVKPALGGVWLEGTGFAKELGLEIRDYWGVTADGEITRTLFDSSGITGTVRSKGWSGEVLVLEGTIDAGARVRETITRRGARAFDAVWESNTDGTWSAYSVEHLTR